jgi:hypothetical protein
MSESLYPWRNSPWYPLDRRIGGPIADLNIMEQTKFLPLPEIEPRFSSSCSIAIPTSATTSLILNTLHFIQRVVMVSYDSRNIQDWKVVLEVFTPLVMNCSVVWDIMPCRLFDVNGRFVGTCLLLLQVRKISQTRTQL